MIPVGIKRYENKKETKQMENVNLIETATDNRKNEKGVTTVEYAVMLVIVAVVVMTATPNIGGAIKTVFQNIINVL